MMIQEEKSDGYKDQNEQEKKESEELEGRRVRGGKEKRGIGERGRSLGRRVCARVSVERWMDGRGWRKGNKKMPEERKEKEKRRRTSNSSVRLCIIIHQPPIPP